MLNMLRTPKLKKFQIVVESQFEFFEEAGSNVLQKIGSGTNSKMGGEEKVGSDEACNGKTMDEVLVRI